MIKVDGGTSKRVQEKKTVQILNGKILIEFSCLVYIKWKNNKNQK